MTKHLTLLPAVALVLALASTACTDDRDTPAPAPPADAAARCTPDLDAAFGAWAAAGFSGSVAVSTNGQFDCLAGYGTADDAAGTPITPGTVFSIGSITKAVTAATVFDLIEDGKLSLDDRAGEIIPGLTGPAAAATVRQLMLHTSGLKGSHGNDSEPLTRDAAIAAIGELNAAFAPGKGYLYSNAGYTLLALMIEKVSGMSYREYTASKTLRLPDGRTAGGFWSGEPKAPGPRAAGHLDGGQTGERGDFAGPHWAVDGNGGVAMTARDLAAWTHALFTGRVVSADSAKVIANPGVRVGGGRSETPGWVAYDKSVFGEAVLATAGGGGDVGHNAVVAWVPGRQRVVAMMSNRPELTAEKVLEAVGRALLTGEPLPTPNAPTGPADAPAAVGGTYRLPGGASFRVLPAGRRITISASGTAAVAALFPPRRASAAEVREHESRVSELLAGRTDEGRKERRMLENTFGPVTSVAPAGTIERDGELRSYVTINAGTRTVTGWYALDEAGAVAAAEVPTSPPTLAFVPTGTGRYRPDDPTGTGPAVTVEFRDGRMTVSGPGGTLGVQRAG